MKKFATAQIGSLTHDLRNGPTWDQLWDSGNPKDRDAYFDGEEGLDFTATATFATLLPRQAAKEAQPNGGRASMQQQQNVPPVNILHQKYRQQRRQQIQLVL